MKSDVSAVQLNQVRKVSYTEAALIGVILVIATKFCTLPSVLAGIAGGKAIWVIAILTATEFLTAFFAVKIAKRGGVPSLPLPRGVKVAVYSFYALFFALKLAAFTREISTYYALSLFENVPVLPVMVLTIIACALIARKGYMAVGRMLEILMWLFLFVFLFIAIFTRTTGNAFNLFAMVNPDVKGMGKGVWQGAAWYGDVAVLAFLDLSGETSCSPHAKNLPVPSARSKAKRRIACTAALFSFVALLLFYAVFTSVYGGAAKMTDYAFIKLSAFRANSDELGSADWPIIILWAIVTTVYLTLLLISGRESLYGLILKEEGKRSPFAFALLGIAAIVFAMFFLDEEGDYQGFMTKVASAFVFLSMGVSIALGIIVLARRKGERNEE